MTYFLGIDPGLNGGFGIVDENAAVVYFDKMPVTSSKKIAPDLLWDKLTTIEDEFNDPIVGIEKLLSLPSDTRTTTELVKELQIRVETMGAINREEIRFIFAQIYAALRKTDGRVGTKTMGINWGYLVGQLAAMRVRFEIMAPRQWQSVVLKHIERSMKPKDRALTGARQLWPKENFIVGKGRTPHDGVVDALLIAEATRRTFKI